MNMLSNVASIESEGTNRFILSMIFLAKQCLLDESVFVCVFLAVVPLLSICNLPAYLPIDQYDCLATTRTICLSL